MDYGLDFFFFNDTATTEIYTLSLHDALPISGHRLDDSRRQGAVGRHRRAVVRQPCRARRGMVVRGRRSEEHTSELQSQSNLVCRLLLEKKKNNHAQHLAMLNLTSIVCTSNTN